MDIQSILDNLIFANLLVVTIIYWASLIFSNFKILPKLAFYGNICASGCLFILLGSSMGAWIALNQFKYFKKQIKGFIGIGSAPEFLDRLMWKKFPKKIRQEIISKGISIIKHGNPNNKEKQYEYPVTYQLIKDGRKNKVLDNKLKSKIFITMIHGSKDEVVPVNYSKKVLNLFENANKKLIVIKNGDHSLSNKKNLKKIIFELKKIIYNTI